MLHSSEKSCDHFNWIQLTNFGIVNSKTDTKRLIKSDFQFKLQKKSTCCISVDGELLFWTYWSCYTHISPLQKDFWFVISIFWRQFPNSHILILKILEKKDIFSLWKTKITLRWRKRIQQQSVDFNHRFHFSFFSMPGAAFICLLALSLTHLSIPFFLPSIIMDLEGHCSVETNSRSDEFCVHNRFVHTLHIRWFWTSKHCISSHASHTFHFSPHNVRCSTVLFSMIVRVEAREH